MAWIESHQSLAKHRKTLRAAALLQISRPQLIGHLHLLWWWSIDNVPVDGALSGLTAADLAAAAEWEGEPPPFLAALLEAGFLDNSPAGLALHNWQNYAGRLLAQRAAAAARQQTYRNRRRRPIYERDGGRCRYCGVALTLEEAVIDHIVPLYAGGTEASDNAVTACIACNARKGGRTPDAAAMRLRPLRAQARRNDDVVVTSSFTGPYRTLPDPTELIEGDGKESINREGRARAKRASPTAAQRTKIAVTTPRAPDLLWDALAAVFGQPRTPQERSRRNAAVAEVRRGAVADGVDEQDAAAALLAAHANWSNVMGSATETPHGLTANLGLLLVGPQVTGRQEGRMVATPPAPPTQGPRLKTLPELEAEARARGPEAPMTVARMTGKGARSGV